MLYSSKAKKYVLYLSTACTIFEGKKMYKRRKVAVTPLSVLVTEGVRFAMWDPKHKHQNQRHESAPCFFTWHGWREITKGKARRFFHGSWKWSLLPQQGESETHNESLGSGSGKSEASQEAEPQWHTHWGGPCREVASIKCGAKLSKLLFLAGARHFHYLGFGVFGCQTEPDPFAFKRRHQCYCLLSFGSLQVCSLKQRMRYSCAVCEERGPSLSLWCREMSERSFNLCCRSIQPV